MTVLKRDSFDLPEGVIIWTETRSGRCQSTRRRARRR